jgi:WD40 repeat protein
MKQRQPRGSTVSAHDKRCHQGQLEHYDMTQTLPPASAVVNSSCVLFSEPGDGGTTVHDAASGGLLASFKNLNIPLSLSPDGRWLARVENDELVLAPIDAKDPRIALGKFASVIALAFSNDGTMLAAASYDGTVSLWDIAKRVQVGTLRGHRERVVDVAFSPDSQWIATGSLDYTTRIWDAHTGQAIATLAGSSSPAFAVKWSPNGDYLAVSMNNASEMYLYRITGRQAARQWLTGHTVGLGRVAAHPLRQQIISSGYRELMSWDVSVPHPSANSIGPNPDPVTSLAYNADGSMLAVASGLKIVVRDPATGRALGQITSPAPVWALAFDPSGKRLACGEWDGKVTLYDLISKQPVHQFVTGSHVNSVAFLDDSQLLTHGVDAVMLFDVATEKLTRKHRLAGGEIEKFVVDSVHKHMVVGLESGAIAGLSLPDLAPGARIENAHDGGVTCLALSPDGRMLASGGRDRRVVLRDAVSFEALLEFPPAPWSLLEMTFDPESRRLAIVGTGSDVELWDISVLREGLAGIGLAWGGTAPGAVQPASITSARERGSAAIPILRRPNVVIPPPAQSRPAPRSIGTRPAEK